MESNSFSVDLCRSDNRVDSPEAECNISNFSFANYVSDQPPSFGLDLSDTVAGGMIDHNQLKVSASPSVTAFSYNGDVVQEVCVDREVVFPGDPISVSITAQANESPVTESNKSQSSPALRRLRETHSSLYGFKAQDRVQTNARTAFAKESSSRNDLVPQTVIAAGNQAKTAATVAAATLSSTDLAKAYPGTNSLQKLRDWTSHAQSALESEITRSADLTKLKREAVQTISLLKNAVAWSLELEDELKRLQKEIEDLEEGLETLPRRDPGQTR